ncbi:MAG: hypothetical protein VB102_01215 [Paludibacter sp.]|nr:hypothetical protein [Paludibacter sp.]
MDSLGDYIYLIVILIAGISSILGKRKKKALENQDPVPGLPDLEDILPEFEPVTEPVRPVYQEVKKKEKPVEHPSYDTVDDFSALKAKKQITHPVKHFAESEMTVVEDSCGPELELENSDDAKKAFIYSEIFNKRY